MLEFLESRRDFENLKTLSSEELLITCCESWVYSATNGTSKPNKSTCICSWHHHVQSIVGHEVKFFTWTGVIIRHSVHQKDWRDTHGILLRTWLLFILAYATYGLWWRHLHMQVFFIPSLSSTLVISECWWLQKPFIISLLMNNSLNKLPTNSFDESKN